MGRRAEQVLRELIGANIARARMAAGLSQRQLAERLGTDRAVISIWENGRRQPRNVNLLALSRELGRPLSYFYEEDGA